jgi:hypothetical protein
MKHVRLVVAIGLVASACGETSDPGTSVEVALQYDDALGLDTAEVTLANRTESARIAHRLLLLVPDELAGVDMPLEIWGRKAGKRAAYGTGNAVPALGDTVTTSLTLTTCSPGCQGDMLTTCTGPMVSCALGCTAEGDARCIGPRPSNGVDPAPADELRGTTRIIADTTFDVDTGEITGGLVRAAGSGVEGGVGYALTQGLGGGAPLAIFSFHNLTVENTATVQFTGTRAVVLLVGDTARIAGTLDVSAGRGARSTPGPGGGAGATGGNPARGCGPGGAGTSATGDYDSGGGGGGGGSVGAAGGTAFLAPTPPLRGAAGPACLPTHLEPLQGGSGGGLGSLGGSSGPALGGGGGGALQITAGARLEITGAVHAGGAGGEGTQPATTAGSGGASGGGSGGAILLEAPSVVVASTAVLAANGGGGGGAGVNTTPGVAGDNAQPSLIAARGGLGSSPGGGNGGAGAIAGAAALRGLDGDSNGGGGGGGLGAIVIRGRARTVAGTSSPAATQLDVEPRGAP